MEAKTAHVDLSFHISLPRNINISNLTQNEIQEAFSGFFQQNPQILVQIFAKLKTTSALQKSRIEQRI